MLGTTDGLLARLGAKDEDGWALGTLEAVGLSLGVAVRVGLGALLVVGNEEKIGLAEATARAGITLWVGWSEEDGPELGTRLDVG